MILGLTMLSFFAAYLLFEEHGMLLSGAALVVMTFGGSYWLCRQVIAATPEHYWDAQPSDPAM
jgi:hypothetical protein